ncbi:MAG: hypothetical protein RJA02_825 [Armatimonadota bacterium]
MLHQATARWNDYVNTSQRTIGTPEPLGHRWVGVSAHKWATTTYGYLSRWSCGVEATSALRCCQAVMRLHQQQ